MELRIPFNLLKFKSDFCSIKSKWVPDIQGVVTVGVITEFLHLWDLILNFELR
jgi:hypothetical protein